MPKKVTMCKLNPRGSRFSIHQEDAVIINNRSRTVATSQELLQVWKNRNYQREKKTREGFSLFAPQVSLLHIITSTTVCSSLLEIA